MLTTRAEWRTKVKEKFGVPDKVCSFSMGERIESWNKKREAAGKDYKVRLAAVDGLLKDLKTYEAALKSVKPTKFKGKTPAEQTKNHKDAQTALHTAVADYTNFRGGVAALAFPLVTLKQNLTAARTKLNGIAKTDLDGLKEFYSTDYRNDCGKFVIMALKQNPAGKLKTALESWETIGETIDALVDDCATTDLPKIAKIHAACKMGVEGLAIQVL